MDGGKLANIIVARNRLYFLSFENKLLTAAKKPYIENDNGLFSDLSEVVYYH